MSAVTLAGPLEDRDTWTAERCSLDRAIQLIGNRSAVLLMRVAFYGAHRFDQFARRSALSEPVVAAQLRHLVREGLLEQRPYKEPGQRSRNEYVLTEKGRDLFVALVGLMQWGDRWLAPEGAPIELSHSGCAEAAHVELRCDAGHRLELDEVVVNGAPRRAARRPKGTR